MHEELNTQSITHIIEHLLCLCGLNIMNMQGQTYDGVSVLQGKMSGVAKLIKHKNLKALTIHCMNHRLNLILQEVASKYPVVRGGPIFRS